MTDETPERVKLQIQVEREVAEGMDELAKRLNRSRAWMAVELLVEAVKVKPRFVDWLTFRFIGLLTSPRRNRLIKMFGRKAPRERGKQMMYFPVFVSPGLVEDIDELAEAGAKTRAEMCSELLTYAYEDQAFLWRMAASKTMQTIADIGKVKRGEQSRRNREENRKRRDDE